MEQPGVLYRKPKIDVTNEGVPKSTKRKNKPKNKPTNNNLANEIMHSIFCNCKTCVDYSKWKMENKKSVTIAVPGLDSFPPLNKGNKTEANPSPKQMSKVENKKTDMIITKNSKKSEKSTMPNGPFETPNRFSPLANLKENNKEPFSSLGNAKVHKKTFKVTKYRGGGKNDDEEKSIFEKGIEIAKKHGINVKADLPNKKQGDCLFEAVVDNINHRKCFTEKLDKSIQEYREEFVSEMQLQFQQTDHYPGEHEHDKWNEEWGRQKNPGEYNVNEYNISDIVPTAMGHCVKKNIMIINVAQNNQDPVQVCKSTFFHESRTPTTEIPVIVVYNGGHYESMLPKTQQDIEKSVELANKIIIGNYDKNDYNSPPPKRRRDMNPDEKRQYDSLKRKEKRQNETKEQREQRLKKNAARMAEPENKAATAARMAKPENKVADAARKSQPEYKAADAERKAEKRKITKTKVTEKEGLMGQEIWNGTHTVPDLKDSFDTIGKMEHPCPDCGAIKFKKETSSNCCQNGKVILPALPDPPETLQKLWNENTPEANLFRKHCRSINNAVCLTSIKVKERTFEGGYNPSVIFQGKVMQFSGPLQAEAGETPVFAQLYVHDPNLQESQRFANMSLPANMSQGQKEMLRGVLRNVQNVLQEVNPFVNDFKQIIEMPDEELAKGILVINAKARPTGEHCRRYNEQTNLKEVSVLTSCQPHDLVLNKRGGGLQTISDLNPKAMPLHFTLLFPYGTYGWDQDQKQTGGVRRVTPREFAV